LKIFVDSKEPPRVFVALKKLGVDVECTSLEIGDICTEKCIVERKSFNDYVTSLVDGRLFDQLSRMFESDKPCFIVIHDYYHFNRNVTPKQVFGSIAAAAVEYGVNILWVPKFSEAMYVVVKLLEKVEQGKFLRPKRYYKYKKETLPYKAKVLKRMFGLPDKVAVDLLRTYGSIEKICQLDEAHLMRVEGIGELRAKRIRWIVT